MTKHLVSAALKQSNTISTHALQFLSVLQMNTTALNEFVSSKALENPAFDVIQPCDDVKRGLLFRELGGQAAPARRDGRNTDNPSSFWENIRTAHNEYETLQIFLEEQLSRKRKVPKDLLPLCRKIILNLDQRGFLPLEDWNALFVEGVSIEAMEAALESIQALEPPGIAARDIQECLVLQLRRMKGDHTVHIAIIQDHLELLKKQRYGQLARLLHCSVAEIRTAVEEIRQLRLYPIEMTASELAEKTDYVYPDVLVEVTGAGDIDLYLSKAGNIQVKVNSYYIDLYRQTEDEEVRKYLKAKLAEAQWMERNLRQRTETYRDCIYEIAQWQKDFLADQSAALRPMRMQDIAEKMGVHVSTVSRTVRDSWMQCSRGSLPVRSLFAVRLNGDLEQEGRSADYIKSRILDMVGAEDKRKPISDQDIAQSLLQENILISRRTIAKYRARLGIPNQYIRREE